VGQHFSLMLIQNGKNYHSHMILNLFGENFRIREQFVAGGMNVCVLLLWLQPVLLIRIRTFFAGTGIFVPAPDYAINNYLCI
jgi:hypothetical protein